MSQTLFVHCFCQPQSEFDFLYVWHAVVVASVSPSSFVVVLRLSSSVRRCRRRRSRTGLLSPLPGKQACRLARFFFFTSTAPCCTFCHQRIVVVAVAVILVVAVVVAGIVVILRRRLLVIQKSLYLSYFFERTQTIHYAGPKVCSRNKITQIVTWNRPFNVGSVPWGAEWGTSISAKQYILTLKGRFHVTI
jgi:hypothetical protein